MAASERDLFDLEEKAQAGTGAATAGYASSEAGMSSFTDEDDSLAGQIARSNIEIQGLKSMVLTLMHFSHVACFSFQSDRSSNIEAPNLSSKQRAERNGPGLQKGSIYPPYFPELALKVGYI